MSFGLKAGIVTVALFLLLAGLIRIHKAPEPPTPMSHPATLPLPAVAPASMIPPPDLRELATRATGVGQAPPNPEQTAAARQVEAEQIAAALQSLRSADGRERVEGAEQLGAYPTPAAGKALVKSLLNDPTPAVRVAAAASLVQFQSPDVSVVSGLLTALRDSNGEVREAAFSTLAVYLEALDAESARRRQVLAGLGKLAKTRSLDPAWRQTLRDLLADR